MRNKFDIFISYKRTQRDAAMWLAGSLREKNYRVWWDADLIPGTNYITLIQEVIANARLCIVLWDREAVRSDYVLSEALCGHHIGTYKPFLLESDLLLPPPFTAVHAEDLSDWVNGPEEAAERACNSVEEVLPAPANKSNEDQMTREIAHWAKIEKSRNLEDFEEHLAEYGADGMFAKLAKERSERLREARLPDQPQVATVPKKKKALLDTMIELPAGTVIMGTNAADERVTFEEERPQIEVQVVSFWLGKGPVSFAEYDAFCADTGRDMPDDMLWGRGDRPVINVSFGDANDYCTWLSERSGLLVRLPSEAEWEYAARAGGNSLYAWGENWQDGSCNGAMIRGRTTPVGRFGSNQYGLYDMIGNVWEYCADTWSDTHDGADPTGRARTECDDDDSAVIRGGAWDSAPEVLRPAMRWCRDPETGGENIGFRIAVHA